VAVARLHVVEPVVLVRRRAQRLREQRDRLGADRELAAARHVQMALGADDVADVEVERAPVGGLAEVVLAQVELDRRGPFAELQERRPAVPAARDQPPGDAVAVLAVLARAERGGIVRELHARDLGRPRERARERVDPFGAQPLQLRAAIVHLAELAQRNSHIPLLDFPRTATRRV
jgi:hypothetical protein